MPSSMIDEITQTFLTALEVGGVALSGYSIAILAIVGLITYYKQYTLVMMHGTGLGDALAQALLLIVGILSYKWVVGLLWEMGQASLSLAMRWGGELSGRAWSIGDLQTPSFILNLGLRIAFPHLETGSWWQRIWSVVNMPMFSPDTWVGVFIVAAFIAVLLHHIMMIIEFFIALATSYVLIPWGLWHITAPLAEFSLGWITGSLIRALLSMSTVGIGVGVFESRLATDATTNILDPASWFAVIVRLVAAALFAVLCWTIPARAANRVGSAALALTGNIITSTAMTGARLASAGMAHAAFAANRASSRMMQSRGMA